MRRMDWSGVIALRFAAWLAALAVGTGVVWVHDANGHDARSYHEIACVLQCPTEGGKPASVPKW